jgi:hypothetical protein
MYKIFEILSITIAFYLFLFVIWTIFIVPVELSSNSLALGSLLFLPHAARVLPVVYFGPWALLGIIIAEYICWFYIWPFEIFDRTGMGVLISSFAIAITWAFFKLLDAELKPFGNLQNTNWKHLVIFIIFSALFNGLGNGAYYPTFGDSEAAPLISIRFVMGDIIGSLVVIIFLAIFRKVTIDLT